MFTDMGYQVFSPGGAYMHPYGDEGRKRPGIPGMPYDPHFVELATRYSKDEIHPEMLEGVDVVIINHIFDWVTRNWHTFVPFMERGMRVVWRSIGQSTPELERQLATFRDLGLELVRYSPIEERITGYAGGTVIRFGQKPEEWGGWAPVEDPKVVNFSQSVAQRGTHCGWDVLRQVADRLPGQFDLYGPGNEGLSWWRGMVPYDVQRQTLRDAGAVLYTGTHPTCYTLAFMEAWMTGAPVVSLGKRLGDPAISGYPQDTFEVPEIIRNGVTGFVCDTVDDIVETCRHLLSHPDYAAEIGKAGRAAAVEMFAMPKISAQWKSFVEGGRTT